MSFLKIISDTCNKIISDIIPKKSPTQLGGMFNGFFDDDSDDEDFEGEPVGRRDATIPDELLNGEQRLDGDEYDEYVKKRTAMFPSLPVEDDKDFEGEPVGRRDGERLDGDEKFIFDDKETVLKTSKLPTDTFKFEEGGPFPRKNWRKDDMKGGVIAHTPEVDDNIYESTEPSLFEITSTAPETITVPTPYSNGGVLVPLDQYDEDNAEDVDTSLWPVPNGSPF